MHVGESSAAILEWCFQGVIFLQRQVNGKEPSGEGRKEIETSAARAMGLFCKPQPGIVLGILFHPQLFGGGGIGWQGMEERIMSEW